MMNSKSISDFTLSTAEEVLEVPFNILRDNVIHPILRYDVKTVLALSFVLVFLSYLLVNWKSAPKSCKEVQGTCFKIFKGVGTTPGLGGLLYVLRAGLEVVYVVIVLKLVARGVQAHGIKPSAFVSVVALWATAEVANVLFTSLFTIALSDGGIYTAATAGENRSFKYLCQQYLYTIVQRFRYENSWNTSIAVIGGVVAGSLAA
jgi:hypothetical protein